MNSEELKWIGETVWEMLRNESQTMETGMWENEGKQEWFISWFPQIYESVHLIHEMLFHDPFSDGRQ